MARRIRQSAAEASDPGLRRRDGRWRRSVRTDGRMLEVATLARAVNGFAQRGIRQGQRRKRSGEADCRAFIPRLSWRGLRRVPTPRCIAAVPISSIMVHCKMRSCKRVAALRTGSVIILQPFWMLSAEASLNNGLYIFVMTGFSSNPGCLGHRKVELGRASRILRPICGGAIGLAMLRCGIGMPRVALQLPCLTGSKEICPSAAASAGRGASPAGAPLVRRMNAINRALSCGASLPGELCGIARAR